MKSHFYKYADIESAEAILASQSFRYSSPLKFNDPFDIQNTITPDFNASELVEALMSEIEKYIKSDIEIPNVDSGFGKGISILRKGAAEHGYKREEIERITYPLLGHQSEELIQLVDIVNRKWSLSMKESRVFCVTETKENLLMWAHYAKDHTGAVFKIATLPECDTPLSVARKVNYEEHPVKFYSLQEVVEWVLFDKELDASRISFSAHAYRKSNEWAYEKEWRVVDMCQYANKQELHVDHKFIPRQLEAVYFGCKCQADKIRHLSRLAREINPNVELYTARKKVNEYSLAFDKT